MSASKPVTTANRGLLRAQTEMLLKADVEMTNRSRLAGRFEHGTFKHMTPDPQLKPKLRRVEVQATFGLWDKSAAALWKQNLIKRVEALRRTVMSETTARAPSRAFRCLAG